MAWEGSSRVVSSTGWAGFIFKRQPILSIQTFQISLNSGGFVSTDLY